MEKTRKKSNKLKPIARKRRNYIYLLFSILFAISTGYIFFNFPPDYKFYISNFGIPVLPIFFISFATFIFSLITFIFKSRLQGLIFALFLIFCLILRLTVLKHWLFLALILALFATTELFIHKKK